MPKNKTSFDFDRYFDTTETCYEADLFLDVLSIQQKMCTYMLI